MKRKIKAFKFLGILALTLCTVLACENDYNSLNSDIQGIQNFETNKDKFAVVAYNKRVRPTQTNNIPSNFLGIYYDQIYAGTINNIITQVVPRNYNPSFGTNPVFKHAYLTIPYYSSVSSTSGDETYYDLDSLYGNTPIKLSIYRSNYFLRDFNPATDDVDPQYYYSNNDEFGIDSNLGTLLYEDLAFKPSNNEQIIYEDDEQGTPIEVNRISPSLYVELENPGGDYWKTLFFDKEGMPELSNPNNFKDYFRGLYFKVEPIDPNAGSAILLNFNSSAANLTIYYDNEDENGELVLNNKFIMNFRANRASTMTADPLTTSLLNNLNDTADKVNGDQQLYLKGGEGSIAVVNLFEDPAVLDEFNALYKDNNGNPARLINEANLVFYVDQDVTDVLDENQEPNRVFLYDIKNNIPIVDYFYDSTTNTTDPIESKLNYSSALEKDASGKGVKYKIKLTEHLNNILLRDSTNFQLGLYLTTNINEISNSTILNDDILEGIPAGTVLSQKGTVLHGSNQNVPEDKRVQLEILYTQPDN
ncbi:DUF4270 domain-containing protein [Xanthomarina sp. GH4-25]|uniref:DUF4270 domain-containing protein n=1 Tax=Xanthomarina sp. GH4-25 TaxID=3349335 RepID=UPI000D67ED4D|nr:hypothetical protein DI383_04015 [Flavobacteriaceae bacterium LYZ1037]